MKPEIEKLIQEAGLSKLFKPDHVAGAGKVIEPTVSKPQQLAISAEEKTTKPSNWAEAIKAIFELKRKKNL